ncbi:DUF892 family protein [Aquisalimonas sp.]|uniref:YciE/YciF ferroxidase family protein n=1 Tax=Aquisalimonas sp. TaxID=1872621 RepID=UPI0025C45A99|nr:DUF892 family protein [Aquisalimonas sp.]
MDDLFMHQLQDFYDAEKRLTKALQKTIDAANSDKLCSLFDDHLKDSEKQIEWLDGIFMGLGKQPERETGEAMKSLISKGEEMIGAKGDDSLRDAGLIAAAQQIELYEIAGYCTAPTLAQQLGQNQTGEQLQATPDKGKSADSKLTEVAESYVYPASRPCASEVAFAHSAADYTLGVVTKWRGSPRTGFFTTVTRPDSCWSG